MTAEQMLDLVQEARRLQDQVKTFNSELGRDMEFVIDNIELEAGKQALQELRDRRTARDALVKAGVMTSQERDLIEYRETQLESE